MTRPDYIKKFWSFSAVELMEQLPASASGLNSAEARRRLSAYGPNRLQYSKKTDTLTLFLAQFKSPLILILLAAAVVSFFLSEPVDALIIIAIVLLSGVLGFWQEKRAADAVKTLLAIVRTETLVVRDGTQQRVAVEEVVPGDICVFSAGDVIPADALILESKDLFVQEATLTGESFPAEKEAGTVAPETPLMKRTNSLFMGTHVISGSAQALVVHTGGASEFGQVSQRLSCNRLSSGAVPYARLCKVPHARASNLATRIDALLMSCVPLRPVYSESCVCCRYVCCTQRKAIEFHHARPSPSHH